MRDICFLPITSSRSQRRLEFPENPTPESIIEYVKIALREHISMDIIHKPWNIKNTINLDGHIHFHVRKIVEEYMNRCGNIQIKIHSTPYKIHSKFSKRKRKKLQVGEFRQFRNYVIRAEDWRRNYEEFNFTTHDLINKKKL